MPIFRFRGDFPPAHYLKISTQGPDKTSTRQRQAPGDDCEPAHELFNFRKRPISCGKHGMEISIFSDYMIFKVNTARAGLPQQDTIPTLSHMTRNDTHKDTKWHQMTLNRTPTDTEGHQTTKVTRDSWKKELPWLAHQHAPWSAPIAVSISCNGEICNGRSAMAHASNVPWSMFNCSWAIGH